MFEVGGLHQFKTLNFFVERTRWLQSFNAEPALMNYEDEHCEISTWRIPTQWRVSSNSLAQNPIFGKFVLVKMEKRISPHSSRTSQMAPYEKKSQDRRRSSSEGRQRPKKYLADGHSARNRGGFKGVRQSRQDKDTDYRAPQTNQQIGSINAFRGQGDIIFKAWRLGAGNIVARTMNLNVNFSLCLNLYPWVFVPTVYCFKLVFLPFFEYLI